MSGKHDQRRNTPITMTRITLPGGLHVEVPAAGYCDCKRPGFGFTKREDGLWVRPCCLRRSRQVFEKWGNQPIPPAKFPSVGTERKS